MRPCQQCGKPIRTKNAKRFCCHECYAASRRGMRGPGNYMPGKVPTNKLPVGSVTTRSRPGRGGTPRAYVKIAEPSDWALRARVVWEAVNGPLPDGMVLHHADKDAMNDTIANIECLTKAEHLARHREDTAAARRAGLLRAWARRRAAM